MNISFRQATTDDLDWLEVFYERLMRPHVELTHQWDKNKFRECFEPRLTSIIQADGEDISMLKIVPKEDYLYLGDIQIKEAFQRRGIGTFLLKDILSSAKKNKQTVRLRVLKENPAKKLYHRLGFRVISELANCYILEWKAESASGGLVVVTPQAE